MCEDLWCIIHMLYIIYVNTYYTQNTCGYIIHIIYVKNIKCDVPNRSVMKICIIDDNQSITNMLSKLLKIEGHMVTIANGGRAGLVLLENDKFDATILDISMPEFSGKDVVDALNESGRINEQKIIILTASTPSNEDIAQLKEKGVKATLSKPLQLDTLISTL